MINSPTRSEAEDEEDDLFYFESDHLALKGNKDYSELLKTLFILQSQQQRAIKDFDNVVTIHKEALKDPLQAVEKLKSPEGFNIPKIQVIAEIPIINWSKYDVGVPQDGFGSVNYDKGCEKRKHKNIRDFDKTGDTHNKPWTTEEQKRLEELLVIYPPESIELRRFKKIAAALGNRTAKQVCSRVQKYFLKLYKAGLPIPGRIPKKITKFKFNKSLHKHQRYNHYLLRPTTFFPELDIPVVMNDTEDVPGPGKSGNTASSHTNYLIPGTYHTDLKGNQKSDLEYQLDILKRVRNEKEREMTMDDKLFCHIGFRCDYCNEEPINGTRWHCTTCLNNSVDFCTDCIISQMYTENSHPLSHAIVTVRGGKPITSSSYSDSNSSSSSIKNYESSNDDEIEDDDQTIVKRECDVSEYKIDPEEEYGITDEMNTACAKVKCERNSMEDTHSTLSENCMDEENELASADDHETNGGEICYEEFAEQQSYLTESGCLEEDDESEVQNLPYDYLHTIMLSDDTFSTLH